MTEFPEGFEIPDLKIPDVKIEAANKIDMTTAEYVGAVTRVALAMCAQALAVGAQDNSQLPTHNEKFLFTSAALLQVHKGQVVDGRPAMWLKQFLNNARIAADLSPEYWDKFCPVKFTAQE